MVKEIDKHLGKAYPMFRSWVAGAKVKFPKFVFEINDVKALENDVRNAVKNALSSLKKPERAHKRGTEGFDYGYFCGFIQGNINSAWHNEYVYKQTKDFKLFTVVSALDNALRDDELFGIMVSSLYSEYYAARINVTGANHSIGLDLPVGLNFLEIEESNNPILVALENIKIEFINKMCQERVPEFLTNVENFFGEDTFLEMLNSD